MNTDDRVERAILMFLSRSKRPATSREIITAVEYSDTAVYGNLTRMSKDWIHAPALVACEGKPGFRTYVITDTGLESARARGLTDRDQLTHEERAML